jgi:hypothetical protein
LQFEVAVAGGATVLGVTVRVRMFGKGVNVGVAVPMGVLVARVACKVCAAAVSVAGCGVGVTTGKLQELRNIIKIVSNVYRRAFFFMFLLLFENILPQVGWRNLLLILTNKLRGLFHRPKYCKK